MKPQSTILSARALLASAALAVLSMAPVAAAFDPTYAFSYQGQLLYGGTVLNGTVSLRFKLMDASINGAQVGPVITILNSRVRGGLVQQTLNFGNVMDGSPRFLQIEVDPDGTGTASSFSVIPPRVQLLPVPYAMRATTAGKADTATTATMALTAQTAVTADDASTLAGLSPSDFARDTHVHSFLSASDGTPAQALVVDANGNVRFGGALLDTAGNPGAPGQVLSSTAVGTGWIDGSKDNLGNHRATRALEMGGYSINDPDSIALSDVSFPDQQNTLGGQQLAGQPMWQSFTNGVDGTLRSAEFFAESGTTAPFGSVFVYAGEGIDSDPVAEAGFVAPGGPGWFRVLFNTSPLLTVGEVYTISLVPSSGNLVLSGSNSDPYPEGRASLSANHDLRFKTFASEGGISFPDGTTLFSANHLGSGALKVDANGQLGVGTEAPTQSLHVRGSARIEGAFFDSDNKPGTPGQFLTSRSGGTQWQDAPAAFGDDLGSHQATQPLGLGEHELFTAGSILMGDDGPVTHESNAEGTIPATGPSLWQSFRSSEAGEEGMLRRIDVRSGAASTFATGTLTIYGGEGNDGPVLGTTRFTMSGGSGGRGIVLDNPVFIAADEDYTFEFATTSGNLQLLGSNDDPYAFGRSNVSETHDLVFETSITNTWIRLPDNTRLFSAKRLGDGAINVGLNQRVGVGTSAPTEQLHVEGNLRVTGAILDSGESTGASGDVLKSTVTGTEWGAVTMMKSPNGSTATISDDGRFNVSGPSNGNVVEEDNSVALGGTQNSVGAGSSASLGGSLNSLSSGGRSVIVGGLENTVTNSDNAIVGGESNTVTSDQGGVAVGGTRNTVSGQFAATVGGADLVAAGNRSVAMGRRAKALHNGTFIFGDGTDADFSTTGANTFVIRAGGGVGIGTASPSEQLHVQGNTRVTGSVLAGDLAVDSTTLTVDPLNNRVGIGTAAPEVPLSVVGTNNIMARLSSNATNGTWLDLVNASTGGGTWSIISTGSGNSEGEGNFLLRSNGSVRQFVSGTNGFTGLGRSTAAFPLQVGTNGTNGNGAHVTAGGSWTNGSSREFKEGFDPVEPAEVLAKLMTLPITRWRYKGSNEGDHIGPVAEDFHAAFGTGKDPQYITTVDADGVALVAIKALKQENDSLRQKNADLEARLARIEALLSGDSK
jgi:hypothetical protein